MRVHAESRCPACMLLWLETSESFHLLAAGACTLGLDTDSAMGVSRSASSASSSATFGIIVHP